MSNFSIFLLSFLLLSITKEQASETRYHSTALDNVHILEPRQMTALDRQRIIRIYLPPEYASSSQSYPVIYAHDGQNLFDDSTSFVGEWGLDESLNQLAKETGFEAIVVGIDNGQQKRINELSPWANEKYGAAEGVEYMSFIVDELKPFIDSTYRTRPERNSTAIMGSSLGGLISHYAIFQYSDIFGKGIILSPSYWYAEEVWDFTVQQPLPITTRLWLEIGSMEGEAIDKTNRMYEVILAANHPAENVSKKIDPDGEHNEASWRRQFVPAVKWLFEIDK